jgi:hypothetical protein
VGVWFGLVFQHAVRGILREDVLGALIGIVRFISMLFIKHLVQEVLHLGVTALLLSPVESRDPVRQFCEIFVFVQSGESLDPSM